MSYKTKRLHQMGQDEGYTNTERRAWTGSCGKGSLVSVIRRQFLSACFVSYFVITCKTTVSQIAPTGDSSDVFI